MYIQKTSYCWYFKRASIMSDVVQFNLSFAGFILFLFHTWSPIPNRQQDANYIRVHDCPKKFLSITITCSHLTSYGRKTDGNTFPSRFTSPLFCRFGSLGLLHTSQNEEMAGGKKIYSNEDVNTEITEWLFYKLGQTLLCGRD